MLLILSSITLTNFDPYYFTFTFDVVVQGKLRKCCNINWCIFLCHNL